MAMVKAIVFSMVLALSCIGASLGPLWIPIGRSDHIELYGRGDVGIAAVWLPTQQIMWRNSVCGFGAAARFIHGAFYVGCRERVAILDPDTGHVRRSRYLSIDGANDIVPAGTGAVVVEGWNDGATLRNALFLLRASTLQPITDKAMTDSTFLGVVGDRAYVDDWCCNGRPDEYRPATIYWISLSTGRAGAPTDLRPEPYLHPSDQQPLGQGEHNYLIAPYFYVPVGSVTYRYDIRNFQLPPVRMP